MLADFKIYYNKGTVIRRVWYCHRTMEQNGESRHVSTYKERCVNRLSISFLPPSSEADGNRWPRSPSRKKRTVGRERAVQGLRLWDKVNHSGGGFHLCQMLSLQKGYRFGNLTTKAKQSFTWSLTQFYPRLFPWGQGLSRYSNALDRLAIRLDLTVN